MPRLNRKGSNFLPTVLEASENICPIRSLPNELLEIIIRHLSLEDVLRCSQVNRRWFNIVSEQLLRTNSCALVTDQVGCHGFNVNEKAICHLILRNANLWHCFNPEKVKHLESFYFECNKCTEVDLRNLGSMLRQCMNLTTLTLHTCSPLEIPQLEELLHPLKHVRSICLIIDRIDEDFQKSLIEFFNDFRHFYDEIVIQVLNVSNEIVYVCSDKVSLNPHLHGRSSRIVFGHVCPDLVQDVLSHTKMKHIEMDGTEVSTEAFTAVADTPHLEHLVLHSFSSTNQALGVLFKNLSGAKLQELTVTNCSSLTDAEIEELEHLHLDRLDIDFRSCPKVSVEERFLNYCLTHVQSLRIWLDFNETILHNFLSVLEKSCSLEVPVIIKEININILRVNYCSKEVSDHIKDFKSSLRNLARKSSIKVNLAELFTRIKK